jgi:hypothetical protein
MPLTQSPHSLRDPDALVRSKVLAQAVIQGARQRTAQSRALVRAVIARNLTIGQRRLDASAQRLFRSRRTLNVSEEGSRRCATLAGHSPAQRPQDAPYGLSAAID